MNKEVVIMKTHKQNTQKKSPKKALLEIELGYESTQTSNNQIRKGIKKEAQIPWCSKIHNIEVYN